MKLHLDDVLKVLLVVGFEFIFYKTEIEKYHSEDSLKYYDGFLH